MSTTRFTSSSTCRADVAPLAGQALAGRQGRRGRGAQPAARRSRLATSTRCAPAWGHRRRCGRWCLHYGLVVSQATVLRVVLRDGGPAARGELPAERELAARRKAAFDVGSDGCEPGVAAGLLRVRDHHRRDLAAGRLPDLLVDEPAFHISPAAANEHDTIGAIELALAD